MDLSGGMATTYNYKTTKYELPLFFVTVRINVGYKVVAHYIIQSETTDQILQAINILKEWNPEWKPPFFLSDYSVAEISAIERAFPEVTVYICDFHREQAWTRWTRDSKHGLKKQDQEQVLSNLRKCAWAPTIELYQEAVDILKASPEWKTNTKVQQWLTMSWLSIPEVGTYIHIYICTYIHIIHNIRMYIHMYIYTYIISERGKRASSVMFVFNRDFRYVYVAVRQPLRACPDIIAKKRP